MPRLVAAAIVLALISIANAFLYPAVARSAIPSVCCPFRRSSQPSAAPTHVSQGCASTRLYAVPRREDKGPPKKKALKDDVIQVNGRVVESLPNAMFRVEIEPSKNLVLVTISGKIRKNFVRIVVGDSVVCELSAYDLTRGRITYRNK